MENEAHEEKREISPTAEQLVPHSTPDPKPEEISKSRPESTSESHTSSEKSVEKRKKSLYDFFFGWVKDNYDKTFLIILVIAFILRIYIFIITKDQAVWWDAGDYLAAAKRWAGLNPNMIDMWYYRRGFLWPLIGAMFFKSGLGELSIRFFTVLLSTGTVFVSYLLISKIFNKKLALWVSIGMTFSWIYFFFTGRPLTNLPATFFLLISLFFFWKAYVLKKGNKYFYLFGIFFAITILIRMQYLMFIISFLFFAIIKEKFKFLKNKGLWIALIIFIVILIPHLILYNAHFGNPALDLANYYLGVEGISQSGEVGVGLEKTSNLFVYILNIPYILDGGMSSTTLFAFSPIYILFVIGFFLFFGDLFLGLDKIFKSKKIQKKAFILFWIITSFILLGYIAPQLEQRYVMQTLPFLFLIAFYPFLWVETFLIKKLKFNKKVATIVIVIIIILLMIPNYNFGKSLTESKKTSYQEVKWAGEWIKQNSNPEDIIVGGSLPQLTYYSERSVYPPVLAYRRDLPLGNETDLDKFILEKRPKYYSISGYEAEQPWAFAYPDKHKDMMIPVQGYEREGKPILVIYAFDYSNETALDRLRG